MKLTIYIKKFKVEEIVPQNKIFSNLDWEEGESFILKSGDNKYLMVETSTNFSWVSSRLKFYEINKIDGNSSKYLHDYDQEDHNGKRHRLFVFFFYRRRTIKGLFSKSK